MDEWDGTGIEIKTILFGLAISMHPMLNIAIRAARMAGNFIANNYETHVICVDKKKVGNKYVVNINRDAERLIVAIIGKFYPQHVIVCPERRKVANENNSIQWIVDSLNGAANFIRHFPHFAVSIAVRIEGRTEVAVIYDPIRNELFTATRGHGAQLNSYRLRGGSTRTLDATILSVSYPFNQKQYINDHIIKMKKLLMQCADFRRSGSTALDLAYVAAGRLDGAVNIGTQPWDFFCGALLVREAGCLVTDYSGGSNHLPTDSFLAGNPHVIKAMLSIIRDKH